MICPKCGKEIPDDANLCCYCARWIVRKPSKQRTRLNGTGTAYRRGDRWIAVYTVGWAMNPETGKKIQKRITKSGFKTKTEALAYCDELRRGRQKGKTPPNLIDYWNIYKSGELEKLSDAKQCAYKIAWEKMKAIHYTPVDVLSVSALRSVVSEKAKTYYPAKDMKTVLKHLFKLAGADGWVKKDLPEYIVLPTLEETEPEPFSEEEQAALWRVYESGDMRAAVPLVMIYTGMMPGEMLKLKRDMIHLDTQQITNVGIKTKVRKKNPVYIPDTIVPVIEELIERSESKAGYVIKHSEDAFYKDFYAVLEAAGCRKLKPYSCRHTTATALAITENIAPQTIKRVMRWSSTKMLDRYAHPQDKDALAAVNAIKKGTEEKKV